MKVADKKNAKGAKRAPQRKPERKAPAPAIPLIDPKTNRTDAPPPKTGYDDLTDAPAKDRKNKKPANKDPATDAMTEPASAAPALDPQPEIQRSAKGMTVSTPSDPAEREAEAAATKVATGEKTEAGGLKPLQKPKTTDKGATETKPVHRSARAKDGPEVEDSAATPKTQIQRESQNDPEKQKVDANTERQIENVRGQGKPLPEAVRKEMETRFGARLAHVRVHADTNADLLAKRLDANAFTVGADIFFGAGNYDPETVAGRALLAHELTHVVQQGGDSNTIHRDNKSVTTANEKQTTPETPPTSGDLILNGNGCQINMTAETITVPSLGLPRIGGALKGTSGGKTTPISRGGKWTVPTEGGPFILPAPGPRPKTFAFEVWAQHIRSNNAKIRSAIEILVKNESVGTLEGSVYVLGRKNASTDPTKRNFIIGTTDELANHDSIVRPMLNPTDKITEMKFDADHVLEWQLGGKDDGTNMCLLESDYNRKVGSTIKEAINASIRGVFDAAKKESQSQGGTPLPDKLPDEDLVRRQWQVTFKTVNEDGKFGKPSLFWSRDDIEAGKHITQFKALSEAELIDEGFQFKPGQNPTHINVFTGPNGGRAIRFDAEGSSYKKPGFFFKGIEVTEVLNPKPLQNEPGQQIFQIRASKASKTKTTGKGKKTKTIETTWDDTTLDVVFDPRLGFGGYITRESVLRAFGKGHVKELSPVVFPDVTLTDEGLAAHGTITATKKLFPGLPIPLELRGDDLLMDFPIPSAQLDFGPLHLTDTSLALGIIDGNFGIRGEAGVAVDQVGTGRIIADVTKDDIKLAGDFNLELDLFEPANIKIEYFFESDELKVDTTLGVRQGAIPGVTSGQVKLAMSRDNFSLAGKLGLAQPFDGVELGVAYAPDTGLVLEANDVPLPFDKLPGVKDARASLRVARSPDGVWTFSGTGQAKLGVPGATGDLGVTVDGDAVVAKGRVEVAKGPASGWVDIMATNQPLDDSGVPIPGQPTGPLTISGKGQATVMLGKLLKATAGLEYTPQGSVRIDGELALPPTVDLFKRQEFNRELFSLETPDFPIWGVGLGPVKVGIFAFADANLGFESFIGPGQLVDTSVKAKLDLDKPGDATVDGKARFQVPAYAGFALHIGGGLKAQAAVAYVKGRVGIFGKLGFETLAALDVDVHWNARKGLSFEAKASLVASPKFELGVEASLTAGVDLWFTDIEKTWGPWNKKLGEFGPNMQLGIDFPVKWSEEQGLDFNLDNIEVKKPNIDPKALLFDTFQTLV